MALAPQLIDLIVCPDDKGELWYVEGEEILYNPRMRRKYRIEEGIPVLLVEESEIVDEAEDARLRALPHTATGKG
ncbi:MAG: Trm112 family protein [Actinomycetota bacterium]|nr:Trm112 family protein [Actinomycetota bacterium]